MHQKHKDPQELDLTKPRLASYWQKKWKRHQETVCLVDFQLAQRKGLKFYQARCNAIILYDTLQACCISKVVWMETGEVIFETVFRITSTASKDFLQTWLDERIGFRSCSTTSGRSCSTIQKFPMKPTKSKIKSKSWENGEARCCPWHQSRARCKKNVPFSGHRNTFFHEEAVKHDRAGQPVVGRCRKIYTSPRPPPTISFKDNWMKELDPTKTKTQLSRTVRPVSGQPFGSLTQEIDKSVLFGFESTNVRTVRPVKRCVPMSV